ncbi:MAG: ABC transporter substrate-binding protein [Acidimicrobiales bacterium]
MTTRFNHTRTGWVARRCVALVAVALLAVACGGDGEASGAGGAGGTDATAVGSGDSSAEPTSGGVLRVAHTSTPSRLDPHLATSGFDHYVLYPMFDRLVHFEPETMSPIPGLAESWSFTDPLTLTLEVRPGVTFHDGTALDADAVVFNLERGMTHPDSAVSADLGSVDSVEATGDMTVEISLSKPDTALIMMLSDKAGMMVSPSAVDELGDGFADAPVGAGPFAFESYVTGESLVLTAYGDYYLDGQPYLDGMHFTIYDDSRTAVNALVSGQQDFQTLIDAPDIDRAGNADGVELVVSNTLALNRCFLRLGAEPFNSTEVRQALNYGIDRAAINEVINQGLGEPAMAPVPSSHWSYPAANVPVYEYDPERSKALLEEAGYGDGLTIDLIVVNDQRDRTMVEVMQAQLEPTGIELDVTVLDIAESSPAFRERGEGDMYCVGWSGRPDPYGTFQSIYDPASVYITDYTPPEGMLDLLEATIAVEDPEARAEAFRELHEFVTVEHALDFLVTMRPGVQAHSTSVHGYVPNSYGKPIMNDVWID